MSGKDYQATELAKIFNGIIIGGGEILRSQHNQSVDSFIDQGHMLPSDNYLALITPYFKNLSPINQPLILSSVGRWHGEEAAVIEALNANNHPLKAAVYLEIDDNEAFVRLGALSINDDRHSRADDTKEILTERLIEFNEKTSAVIDYYRQSGLLVNINGQQSRQAVLESIINQLASFARI